MRARTCAAYRVREGTQVTEKARTHPQEEGTRLRALIIGINEYIASAKLDYAVKDAGSVRDLLSARASLHEYVNIITMTDDSEPRFKPTRNNLLVTIRLLAETAEQDEDIFFYFAGHGLDINNEPVVLPSDYRHELGQDAAIKIEDIKTILANSKARFKLIVFDSCHSGAVKGREESGRMTPTMFEAFNNAPEGFAIISSCGLNQVSFEDSNLGHGVFTFHFLEGAKGEADVNKDGQVTVSELYDYVSQKVGNWVFLKRGASQTPHMCSNFSGVYVISKIPEKEVIHPAAKPGENEFLRKTAEDLMQPYMTRMLEVVTAFHEKLAQQQIGPRATRIGVFGPHPAESKMVTEWVARKVSELGLSSISEFGYYLPNNPNNLQDISQISPPVVTDFFREETTRQDQYHYIFPRIVSKAIFYMNDERGQAHQLRGCREYGIPCVGFIVHNDISQGVRDCGYLVKKDGYSECVVPDFSFCGALMPKTPFCPFYESIDISSPSKEILLTKREKHRDNRLVAVKSLDGLRNMLESCASKHRLETPT